MYYLRYFIKCCIRNIARLICKPKILFTLLAIILLLFCFGKMEAQAVEIPEQYTYLDYSVKNDITVDPSTRQFVSFGGFRCYYVKVRKGQKLGYTYDSSLNFEKRTCYSENVPTVNLYSYAYGPFTQGNHNAGFSVLQDDLVSPIDGYFCLFVYPTDALDIAFFDRDTVQDVVTNLGSTITQNQDKNTQNIINNNNQNTDKIIDSQEQIEDTLTSTDYDESVVNIDTSDVANVDDSSSVQLFTTIFTNFSNLLNDTSWSQVEIIEIGLPYTDGVITLRSDILSNILSGSFLYTFITVAWYSLFGLYCFRFSTKIYQSIKSGNILNGLNLSDEVITSTML